MDRGLPHESLPIFLIFQTDAEINWSKSLCSLRAPKKQKMDRTSPLEAQQKVFKLLLQEGIKTRFGKEHHFEKILTPNEFSLGVPVRDYEDLKPYIDSVLEGEANVLWPGRPLVLCKVERNNLRRKIYSHF